jgi:hypothetical protein
LAADAVAPRTPPLDAFADAAFAAPFVAVDACVPTTDVNTPVDVFEVAAVFDVLAVLDVVLLEVFDVVFKVVFDVELFELDVFELELLELPLLAVLVEPPEVAAVHDADE